MSVFAGQNHKFDANYTSSAEPLRALDLVGLRRRASLESSKSALQKVSAEKVDKRDSAKGNGSSCTRRREGNTEPTSARLGSIATWMDRIVLRLTPIPTYLK